MSLYVEPLTVSEAGVFQCDVLTPSFAGLIEAVDEGTNTVDFVISPPSLPLSAVSQTVEYAAENYGTLLRRLAD